MGMLTHFPFALFALEDLSPEALDSLLQKAHDGSTVDHWFWYLATADYSAAPQRKSDGTGQQATKAPIDPSFSSPFVGQGLADVAHWLANKPKSVNLDDRFFGVLDKQAENGKIALCRLGRREREVEGTTCVLVEAEQSSLELSGMDSDLDWDELVRNSPYKLDL